MAADDSQPHYGADALAQRAADRLALALEDVGFDVGTEFPALHSGVDRFGTYAIELGAVTPVVASELSRVLALAARYGITLLRR